MELARILEALNAEFGLSVSLKIEAFSKSTQRGLYSSKTKVITLAPDEITRMTFSLFHEFRHALQCADNCRILKDLYGVETVKEATISRANTPYKIRPEEIDANDFAAVFSAAV